MPITPTANTPSSAIGFPDNTAALKVAIADGSGAQITSFGGGTQYTEGDTDTTIAGTAVLWEDASDTLRAVSLAKPLPVQLTPVAAGGLSIFRSLDLDESEEEVKATAGQVYGCWVTNTSTTTRFLKFYNATAANVSVGSTTPVITIGIPGNTSDDISAVLGAGAHGIKFDTAISVAATTGLADADTGAPAANDVLVNIFYL